MIERIVRIKEVCAILGYSRAGLYVAIRAGKFVQPRQIGPRVVGFLESEINEWIRSRPISNPETHHIVRISRQRKAVRDAQAQGAPKIA